MMSVTSINFTNGAIFTVADFITSLFRHQIWRYSFPSILPPPSSPHSSTLPQVFLHFIHLANLNCAPLSLLTFTLIISLLIHSFCNLVPCWHSFHMSKPPQCVLRLTHSIIPHPIPFFHSHTIPLNVLIIFNKNKKTSIPS